MVTLIILRISCVKLCTCYVTLPACVLRCQSTVSVSVRSHSSFRPFYVPRCKFIEKLIFVASGAYFVHKLERRLVDMSFECGKLCSIILEDNFGAVAKAIGETLFPTNWRTLKSIAAQTKIPLHEASITFVYSYYSNVIIISLSWSPISHCYFLYSHVDHFKTINGVYHSYK